MRRKRSDRGFTLVELMVVMGIAAVLVAITIPIARSMSQGNKVVRCASRLQRISQGLRLYAMDWGSVPAYYPEPDGAGSFTGFMIGRGLVDLWDAGYMKGDLALHCPADIQHGRDDAEFGFSFQREDLDAMPDDMTGSTTLYEAEFLRYTYLSSRGLRTDSADPDMRRQLTPLPEDDGSGNPSVIPHISREWHPDDTTVVTWCYHHQGFVKRADEEQYQVLFWDGSIMQMPAYLFQDGDPVEAWRVRPDSE